MSYFVLNDFPKERAQGIARPRELNPDRVRNRSELIGVEAAVIANSNEGGDFIHKKLTPGERGSPRVHAASLAAKQANHDIFGPPVTTNRPPRRHQALSDETVQRIHPGYDNRKDEAQAKMSGAPTMVEKMVADTHPIPINKEVPSKLGLRPVEQAEYANKTLPGFKGMGVHCGPERSQGLATKVTDFSGYAPDLPARSKPLSPRHRNADVFNPINGEKSPYYGK